MTKKIEVSILRSATGSAHVSINDKIVAGNGSFGYGNADHTWHISHDRILEALGPRLRHTLTKENDTLQAENKKLRDVLEEADYALDILTRDFGSGYEYKSVKRIRADIAALKDNGEKE